MENGIETTIHLTSEHLRTGSCKGNGSPLEKALLFQNDRGCFAIYLTNELKEPLITNKYNTVSLYNGGYSSPRTWVRVHDQGEGSLGFVVLASGS